MGEKIEKIEKNPKKLKKSARRFYLIESN